MAAGTPFAIGKNMKLVIGTPTIAELFVAEATLSEKVEAIDVTESGPAGAFTDTVGGAQSCELACTIHTRADGTPVGSLPPGTELLGVVVSQARDGTKKWDFASMMLLECVSKGQVKAGVWEYSLKAVNRGSYTRTF
jgi:hypothetical protein